MISFGSNVKGYASDFYGTIDKNYFQLPILRTKDGREYQAMPDKTQFECAKSLYGGDNTVCIAPTGTGKTAIANYIITKNLYDNKRTIYTTPLKALSNDKYREFCKLYGKENVGLLTGDIKLNSNAPVTIMTTEIYRNMALSEYANPKRDRFKNVGTVVFDEAHYLSEKERGKVWEESIMLTPKGIQILPLSATIGNASEFASWIGDVSGKTTNLVEASPKDRHVPLVYYNYTPNREIKFRELIKGKVDVPQIMKNWEKDSMSQRQIRAIDILYQKKYDKFEDYSATHEEQKEILDLLNKKIARNSRMPHGEFARLIRKEFKLKELEAQEITQLMLDSDSRSINPVGVEKKQKGFRNDPWQEYRNLIVDLKEDNKLPAIIFRFSHAACSATANALNSPKLELTTAKEKEEISEIIEKYRSQDIYLGKDFNKEQLLNGVAPHHAGLLPSYKKLVEELFSKKLLKVVVATSTLSAGINMPAKTAVVTQLTRPSGSGENGELITVPLSANEFHQMTGRAGRRGIDTIGNVVLFNLNQNEQELAQKLILQSADKMKSKYSPNYTFLSAYYQKCHDDELLDYFREKTFKTYQAPEEEKEKTLRRIKSSFEAYRNVLTEDNFLNQTEDGFEATDKGKMLSKAHGYNELTFINMIESKALERLTPVELAGFAGAMAGLDWENNQKENNFIEDLMSKTCFESAEDEEKSPFYDAINQAFDYDYTIEDLEEENGITPEPKTNIFSAYLAYRWALMNSEEEKNPNSSIKNFKNLTRIPKELNMPEDRTYLSVTKKLEEGNVYRIIAQSVDVLKQIVNISEYALSADAYRNDRKYYVNLLKTAQDALELVSKPPIHDALSVA